MEAELAFFADSIKNCSKKELINLCLELKREARDNEIRLKSLREADTAVARDHQAALEKIKELKKQNEELQKQLNHVCERNELLLRQVYGSHNEKMKSMSSSSTSTTEDPLSEEQIPQDFSEDTNDSNREKTERNDKPHGQKPQTPPKPTGKGKLDDPDAKARSAARKELSSALGTGRTKSSSTKMNRANLPHTNTYILDIEQLDNTYGKGNWEIVSWHKKELIQQPIVSCYVEVKYTPVIRDRKSGDLTAEPLEGVLYKRSSVTSSFIARLIYEKVFKSVPIYRQSEDLQNMGLIIPRQDLTNWFVKFAEEYFSTPYFYMQGLQCARPYTQADETILLVLHESGKKTTSKSYVWLHTTGEFDNEHPILIYCYEPTRGTDHLRNYYAGYSGMLTSDAYISYDVLSKESNGRIILCGCMMHARRRFAEALKLIKLDKLTAEQIDALPEIIILRKYGEIYHLEEKLRSLTPEERLSFRQTEGRKLVDELYALIEGIDVTDPRISDKLKDAISYSLNHRVELCRFLEDGMVPCDNGYCERAVRILARGRRAWLFSNTVRGAEASMMAYSMVETAIMNQANPLVYLKYLLEKVPDYLDLPAKSPKLEELMPWSETYRRYEKAQLKESLEMVMPESQDKPSYRPYAPKGKSGAKQMKAAS